MITSEELIEAYQNATPEERYQFVNTLAHDKQFIKMHLFELMDPAQFESVKRLRI